MIKRVLKTNNQKNLILKKIDSKIDYFFIYKHN
jgi:hypothetical protein